MATSLSTRRQPNKACAECVKSPWLVSDRRDSGWLNHPVLQLYLVSPGWDTRNKDTSAVGRRYV